MPDVCIAFKCPIPNMDAQMNGPKPLISLDLATLVDTSALNSNINSSITNSEIKGVVYSANSMIRGDDLKVNLSEDEMLNKTTQFDLHPLVYFRLAKPLKDGVRLPVLDLKAIYG